MNGSKLTLALDGQERPHFFVGQQIAHRAGRPSQIDKIGITERLRLLFALLEVNADDFIRLLDRRRPQKHIVHNAEQSGIRADRKGEREHGHGSYSWTPAHDPDAVAQVLPERIKEMERTNLAALFLGLVQTAKAEEHSASRLVGVHPGSDPVFNLRLEMETQLLIHLGFESVFSQPGWRQQAQSAEPRHDSLPYAV